MSPERAGRQARLRISLIFAFNGFLFACWVPHIPAVKAHLQLSDAALGLALLGPAVGGITSMVLTGRATARYGSPRLTMLFAFGGYLASPGAGLAVNLPTLFLALVLWGAMVGGLDVAMNAQAVQIQARYGRPIMSSIHSHFSLGTVLGAILGGACVGFGASLAAQQAVIGVVLAVLTCALGGPLLADLPVEVPAATDRRLIDFRLALLGVAALCALLAEGASADWSPVYLRDELGVSAGHAGIAYTAFGLMMVTGRIIGDRVIHRLGQVRSLQLMGAIGAIGLASGLLVNTTAAACIGFGCLGLGLSIMVPVFFSTAAHGPGAGAPRIAVVSTLGYLGLLLGPAAIGPLANATSVHSALWALPGIVALAAALGVTAARLTARQSMSAVAGFSVGPG